MVVAEEVPLVALEEVDKASRAEAAAVEATVTTVVETENRRHQEIWLQPVAGGHRGFDILHVAAALVLRADEFLTFDANQKKLAESEGLAVTATRGR